ncbi:hypothetical protein [Oceanobacillus chungangensis]|uniref:Uncharacterized protein n=1 Tax=Oceanobacillus chungangensis TaxID=1229152 RepID=A0A3D8PS24_9BACI|nr:hypothetical protein [Oceanobacillus chungangensis]RDW18926.1 hypothetical protein CWR45_08915 [Oceanobacillus chungangensis]
MKKGKSYFIRTFHINGFLLFVSMLLIIIRVPFKLLEVFLQHETSTVLADYSKIMTRVLREISNVLDGMILLSVGMLLILVVPELIRRIVEDSLTNWFYSIWVSFRLRKFLKRQADHEGEGIFKLKQHNKSIQKSIIDIRNQNITYIIKLPNDVQVQKIILDTKDILREEISSRFSEYSFSNFERYKHLLIINGTKMS